MTDHTKLLKYRIWCDVSLIQAFSGDTGPLAVRIQQLGLESLKDAIDEYLFALGLDFPNLTMAYLAIASGGATPAKIFQLDNLTLPRGVSR